MTARHLLTLAASRALLARERASTHQDQEESLQPPEKTSPSQEKAPVRSHSKKPGVRPSEVKTTHPSSPSSVEPPPPPPLTLYHVREGETLQSIASQQKVYGDSLLWPLLYKANRDQIKDPSHIYPGQELMIPRDLSDSDLSEAKETARSSTTFPLERATEPPSPAIETAL
ncbi:MAG: hypothetical protein C0621_08395 [Desulfuromonas sp.]|nr:MAG: hypothetical protein C0621_08395 [Desulfuromonas sp.]